MVYKIAIKTSDDTFRFATAKRAVTRTETDLNGVQVQIPTGTFETVIFETTNVADLKTKYFELLNSYRIDQLNAIADVDDFVNYTLDIEEVETKDETSDDAGDDDTTSGTPSGTEGE